MIKYIVHNNFEADLNLFTHILIDNELLEEPPLYILVSNDTKCFLGYIEGVAEYKLCRVVSQIFELHEVLHNSENYNVQENEVKEINIGDFKKIELNIRSLKEALEVLSFSAMDKNNYLFRGQANKEWKIESSIFRKGYDKDKESLLYSEIRHINHDKLNSKDYIQLSCDMQHYGIPTRLVDWTGNLFNAIYFACVSGKEELNKDGIVFALNGLEIIDVDSKVHSYIQNFLEYRYANNLDIDKGLFPILHQILESDKNYIFFKTILSNERIKRQNGYFSICFEASESEANQFLKYQIREYIKRNNNVPDPALDKWTADIKIPLEDSIIENMCEQVEYYNSIAPNDQLDIGNLKEALIRFRKITPIVHNMDELQNSEQLIKLIIPSEYKRKIVNELDNIGINSSTIYPDLQGMTMYIREKYSN
ncbi:FRG domain-containing protein [Metabacillus sp. HB246100]